MLVSSSTNIATALSIYYNGGVPIYRLQPITWNLNEKLLEKHITKRTKAILPVHFLGLPANMEIIMKIAKKYNLKVIEDCAEAHGAKFKNKLVGSFGDIGCYSFYSNKLITTGEGGMLVTNNKKYYENLYIWKILYLENLDFFIRKQDIIWEWDLCKRVRFITIKKSQYFYKKN